MNPAKIATILLGCAAAAGLAASFAPAQAEWGHSSPQERLEHYCSKTIPSEKIAEFQAKRLDHVSEKLKLTDAQKAAFKDLQAVRAKAHADAKAAICAAKPDLSSFEKRLEFQQAKLQRRLDALKAEAPKQIAFYNSLDEKQKAAFDEMHAHAGGHFGHHFGHHWGHGEGGWGHHRDHEGRHGEHHGDRD